MDKIRLDNMAFYGYHGIMPEEKSMGQRFYIDVVLYLDLSQAGRSDDISDTVNYAHVYDMVKKTVEGKPFRLIEKLAAVINEKVMDAYPVVKKIRTTVRKPLAPVPGPLDDVSVTIERLRRV